MPKDERTLKGAWEDSKERVTKHLTALKRSQGENVALHALLTLVSVAGFPEALALEIADEIGLGKV